MEDKKNFLQREKSNNVLNPEYDKNQLRDVIIYSLFKIINIQGNWLECKKNSKRGYSFDGIAREDIGPIKKDMKIQCSFAGEELKIRYNIIYSPNEVALGYAYPKIIGYKTYKVKVLIQAPVLIEEKSKI